MGPSCSERNPAFSTLDSSWTKKPLCRLISDDWTTPVDVCRYPQVWDWARPSWIAICSCHTSHCNGNYFWDNKLPLLLVLLLLQRELPSSVVCVRPPFEPLVLVLLKIAASEIFRSKIVGELVGRVDVLVFIPVIWILGEVGGGNYDINIWWGRWGRFIIFGLIKMRTIDVKFELRTWWYCRKMFFPQRFPYFIFQTFCW